jgi:hypothetical protein
LARRHSEPSCSFAARSGRVMLRRRALADITLLA